MISSVQTPFKIHDENSFIFNPSTKKKGLSTRQGTEIKKAQFVDNTPQKAGACFTAPKSQRKALTNLSVSQVNSRTPAPLGASLSSKKLTVNKEKKGSSSSTVKAFSTSASIEEPMKDSFRIFTDDDMLCTMMSVEEDPYDFTVRAASKMTCSLTKPSLTHDSMYEATTGYDFDSAFAKGDLDNEGEFDDGILVPEFDTFSDETLLEF